MTYIVLIYLKGKKKPFEIEFDKANRDKFFNALTHDLITVGPLTFLRNDFHYCIEKVK